MEKQSSGVLDWLSQRLNLTEIFSLLTSYGLFYTEVDTNKRLREALSEALEKPSPSYARWPRVLGLIVVVLIAVEILTGVLLTFYYLPTPQTAHPSVGTIMRHVHFGWLIHQIHFWGAQLLVAVLIVRLLRLFVQRVYQAPRELVWVFGALLLLVCLHADATGRLLPWTSGGYWSAVRALEVVASVPLYGDLVTFLIGGDQAVISDFTLIRFYVLHVAVLPALTILLIYLHFSTVRRVGLSERAGETRLLVGAAGLRQHLVNLAILLALCFGALVTLAVLAPKPFLGEADPFSTLPGARPPWYLLAAFGFLELSSRLVPQWLGGTVLGLTFVLFVAIPFLDRSRKKPGISPVILGLAVVALILWITLTIYGSRIA